MPSFEVTVVYGQVRSQPVNEQFNHYRAARYIAQSLDVLGATTLREVSGGEVAPTGVGWPVTGTTVDDGLCKNRAPIYVVMRMNPQYGGFDFSLLLAELHSVFRRCIWESLVAYQGAEAPCNFMVRIEFMPGAGSYVSVDGCVSEEYGGETGVVQLALS